MNNRVPTYSLYGEMAAETPEFWLHAESIASRSQLHGWEIGRHRHERLFQILHIRSGEGQALLNGRWHGFGAMTVITVPERHDHGFRFSDDIDGAVMTMVSRRFLSRLPAQPSMTDWLSRPRLVPLPPDQADSDLVSQMLTRGEKEIMQGSERPSALIESLFSTAIQLLVAVNGAHAAATLATKDEQRFAQLNDLIGDGFRKHMPVDAYARRLGVSTTHLNRITRAICGKPVSRMIAERIISEAKRDLVFTTISVQQVATALGFDDQAYFSRFFTRHAGLSPKAYRDRERALMEG